MDIAGQFSGFNYFQWLLTRFSTPEELFGPLSLRALEEDVYRRNTKGKLPEAHMAFLDEIFKAGSAILNTFLTLVNERIFYNDGTPIKSPLQTVIGASNEYPEEDEGLEALYDRFLLRFDLKYIGEEGNFIKILQSETTIVTPLPAISFDELADRRWLQIWLTFRKILFLRSIPFEMN
ncbi:AAA family ATPase [Bacillus sp. 37MA]|uniref:AAA family ATPase n=1 Tax=Bacillus sp. 37MA TaxID=1132442 RepID=UPI00039E737B|nr:AAA family ATPase [Bacillus sp. 37MA]